MNLFRKIFSTNRIRNPLNQIDLGNEYFKYQGIMKGIRVWYTHDGDGVGLHYFGLKPDLPNKQTTTQAFISQYLALLGESGIDVAIETVAEIPAIRTIAKAAQEPSGMTYLGSYTLPFRDFSYVIKIQCEERGMTGIREAVLFEKIYSTNEIIVDDSGNIMGEFSTDDEKYDNEFPDHPLSRCRRSLHQIKSSITLAEEVRQLPLFDFPHE